MPETTALVQVGDFNGDGKADIAGRIQSTGDWWVSISSGNSFGHTLWDNWNPAVTWVDVQVGDFNNDGMADIAGRDQLGEWFVSISNGTSFHHLDTAWATWNPTVNWGQNGQQTRTGRFAG